MATAAPAAPSTAAPAAPSPGSAPATQPAAQPTSTTPASPAPAAPRIRPIPPPSPALPGVIPDGDDSPIGGLPADASSSSGERHTGPARGPDGRFTASAPPADAATTAATTGDHTVEPGTPEPAAVEFEFAGQKFPSREAAEQSVRSLRGMFRPLQNLGRNLGGLDKIEPALVRAAESARGWKAEAERYQAELEAARRGGATPASTPAEPAPAVSPTTAEPADVDWALYAEVKKLATEAGEPWKAEQWLIGEVRKAEQARYEQLLNERLAPFDAAREHSALAVQTETLFGNLAEYSNSDGSPAFPELHDPDAAHEIGRLWASLGLPAEAALSPQGAIAAVALYRMSKPSPDPARSAMPPTPSPVAPAAPPAPPSDAAAAASLSDGRVAPASLPGADGPSAEAARILAGLRSVNAGSAGRAVLGFDA